MLKRVLKVLTILIVFLLLLFLFLKMLDIIKFKCIFKEIFGIYCAGCGTTRMIKSIFSLQFYQAFRYNPLIFIVLIVSILYILYASVIYIKKGKVKFPPFKLVIIIVILLFIYMFLRNIHGFEFLRPNIL